MFPNKDFLKLKTVTVLFVLVICILAGCSNPAPSQKAEPVGVVLSGHDNLPEIKMAVRISPSVPDESVANLFAGVVSNARENCINKQKIPPGNLEHFFVNCIIEEDHIELQKSDNRPTAFSDCIINQIDGMLVSLGKNKHVASIEIMVGSVEEIINDVGADEIKQ